MSDMQSNPETHGGITKIDRYQWKLKDASGEYAFVDKRLLRIDLSYQRQSTESKIKLLARDWSWVACGAICVARRIPEEDLFVIDGQHRVAAALRRSDIQHLPCMVFETISVVDEAAGFLAANTQRKPITSMDKFRALVITKDPAALFVQDLCNQVGRVVTDKHGVNGIRCVALMLRLASREPVLLTRLWPLIHQLHHGQQVSERLLDGLMYVEQHMPVGESLTDRKWSTRVLHLGTEHLMAAANRAAAFYQRGGAKVWGDGMVTALNFKLTHRLVLTNTPVEQ